MIILANKVGCFFLIIVKVEINMMLHNSSMIILAYKVGCFFLIIVKVEINMILHKWLYDHIGKPGRDLLPDHR